MTDSEVEEPEIEVSNGNASSLLEEENVFFANLPEHACRYCGVHDPMGNVRCGLCERWFCNIKSKHIGSHIIFHLRSAQHKEIVIDSKELSCFVCNQRNVFNLGYTPDRLSQAFLICRQPCLGEKKVQSVTLNLSEWQPIVTRLLCLPEWLVPTGEPKLKYRKGSRHCTMKMMNDLERKWLEQETWKIPKAVTADFQEIPETFRDVESYCKAFGEAVRVEKSFDYQQSQPKDKVCVRWEECPDTQRRKAFFIMPHVAKGINLSLSSNVTLHYKGEEMEEWRATGKVIKVPNQFYQDGILGLLLLCDELPPPPVHVTDGYMLELMDLGGSFERMQAALQAFRQRDHLLCSMIVNQLLGKPLERNDQWDVQVHLPPTLQAPGLPSLNDFQIMAVETILLNPLTLIQGPPGTGKTVVSATAIYHMVQQKPGQVLVCTPSNVAIDHLCDRIALTGVKVVRMMSRYREEMPLSSHSCAAHLLLQEMCLEREPLLAALKLEMESGDEKQAARAKNEFIAIRSRVEQEILQEADVICCTCSCAGDWRIENYVFHSVLIDECGQSSEPESLVAIVKGIERVVLVGDHHQLAPVIQCQQARDLRLNRSLFKRLADSHLVEPVRLLVQFRMHPGLCTFPSKTFYDGTLINGVTAGDRKSTLGVHTLWSNPSIPSLFYGAFCREMEDAEEISSSATSYLNRLEAQSVEKFVLYLLKYGVNPSEIGVISPYEGQVTYMQTYMVKNATTNNALIKNLAAIEISSVDAFQGREKDFIIFSCVRDNIRNEIGFLHDPRRLNVAITRARRGLVIIGNPKFLTKHNLWNSLLHFYKSNRLMVHGNLHSLHQSSIQLRPELELPINLFDLEPVWTRWKSTAQNNGDVSLNESFEELTIDSRNDESNFLIIQTPTNEPALSGTSAAVSSAHNCNSTESGFNLGVNLEALLSQARMQTMLAHSKQKECTATTSQPANSSSQLIIKDNSASCSGLNVFTAVPSCNAKEMTAGSKEMASGSKEMASGSKEIASSSETNEMTAGLKEMASGSKEMASGFKTKEMTAGSKTKKKADGSKTNEMAAGSKTNEMAAGSKEKTAGSIEMASASNEMAAGSKEMACGSKMNEITAGSREMTAGSKTKEMTASSSTNGMTAGISTSEIVSQRPLTKLTTNTPAFNSKQSDILSRKPNKAVSSQLSTGASGFTCLNGVSSPKDLLSIDNQVPKSSEDITAKKRRHLAICLQLQESNKKSSKSPSQKSSSPANMDSSTNSATCFTISKPVIQSQYFQKSDDSDDDSIPPDIYSPFSEFRKGFAN